MALVQFKNTAIRGVTVCVPKHVKDNQIFGKDLLPTKKLKKTLETIGIYQRRVATKEVCTSDLCCTAAENLISKLNIDKKTIDAVLFVSQTPDYRTPASACIIQDRLGLSKSTIAFDINLGCSGYVYGLFNAFSFLNNVGINSVLLLAGDTPSKFTSEKDVATSFLFGDAGAATIIEKVKEENLTHFSLNTDGSGKKAIFVPAGGYREPSSRDTLLEETFDNGSVRSKEQIVLAGLEVFNFTIKEVCKDIKKLIARTDITLDDIDKFYLHQANEFMLNYLRKKLKVDKNKLPIYLKDFGNTSSASIPLTMVLDKTNKEVILSGFGVGLSWGTCYTNLKECSTFNLIEYEK